MASPVTTDQEYRPGSEIPGDGAMAALTLLNRALVALVAEGDPTDPLQQLLRDAKTLSGASALAIFRLAEGSAEPVAFAWTPGSDRESMAACVTRFRYGLEVDGADTTYRVAPLDSGCNTHTWLVAGNPRAAAVSPQRRVLLDTLAEGLGEVLAGCATAERQRRTRIREERAAIARELHDSLAQSLSYLKIQASRLQSALNDPEPVQAPNFARMNNIVDELRSNLNLAYRQLRELITTFRLTMNGRTLSQAVEESVDEFQRRSAIVFEVDDRLCGDELEADEEIQVLQIAREALTNIVRHSHARHARLTLRQDESGELVLSIEDDGVGLDGGGDDDRHHGLVIMQERARDLAGVLRVEPAAGVGTRVCVRFLPRALAQRGSRT